MEGFENFADIPEVDADAQNVKDGVYGLGAGVTDIIEMENASFLQFKKLIKELRDIVSDNWRNG